MLTQSNFDDQSEKIPIGKDNLSQKQRRRKNRLEGGALLVVVFGLMLLTLVQREVIDLGPGFSENRGLIALVSINLSVLLTTLLILLTLRQLYRIFFERQAYGSLQTKMVVAFICLSLLPTMLIFYYSYRQLVRGHDLWFSSEIEEALTDSLKLTDTMLRLNNKNISDFGEDLLRKYKILEQDINRDELLEFLEQERKLFHLNSIELYDKQGVFKLRSGSDELPIIYHEWFMGLKAAATPAPPWAITVESPYGDFNRMAWPILDTNGNNEPLITGYLALGQLSHSSVRSQMEDLRHAITQYQEVLKVQRPFRVTQLTALTAMALLAVFISVWIGSHLARSLARPVLDLLTGTKKVAAGNLDYILAPQWRSGEFAELVNSFNQMTRDLKKLYVELDSRRRFVETVLKNVSTGVVVLDIEGKMQVLNQAAQTILSEASSEEENSAQGQTLPKSLLGEADKMMSQLKAGRKTAESHVRLNAGEELMSLKISLSTLRNEDGETIAYLMAFDNLTEQEKAQRLAAWREVARRIAHEVKNPLTPIQLSAQRLERRFSKHLSNENDREVFSECTSVIIRQVDEMKKLVDEFSRFSRLPEVKLKDGDFCKFLTESLALFRQAHKGINFLLEIKQKPPKVAFDSEQMRRVLTNILDNSVAAMNKKGEVIIELEMAEPELLSLSISDSGPGLSAKIIDRLFEPYISSKVGGQGLGLAIVRTIINDHSGSIRARNNKQGGAKFTIELPIKP